MPGVPRELAEHSLNVRSDAKLVKQPLRCFAEEKRKAIGEEIAQLQAAGFIMEVFYPDWLANPVLVLKKNNTWHMCIDYTSLNKGCPKDPFALPRIDQVIGSTAGCDLLSFLDAYSGYHQIPLYQPDQIKIDVLHHPIWSLLLRHHAIRLEECWSYLLVDHAVMSARADWAKCARLCG
jgi:hypothetical protein